MSWKRSWSALRKGCVLPVSHAHLHLVCVVLSVLYFYHHGAPRSHKMIIFWFIFHLIFGKFIFKLCYKNVLTVNKCDTTFQHSTCVTWPFNLFVMPPKTKKGPTSKPQSLFVPKWAQKPSSKVIKSATINSSDKEDPNSQLQSTKVCHISWTTARTEQLLDWLEEDPVDQHKLFSDSTKDAKDEGWRKCVAKGTKSEFHRLMAVMCSIVWWNVQCTKQKYNQYAETVPGWLQQSHLRCWCKCKGVSVHQLLWERVNGTLVWYLSTEVREIPMKTDEMWWKTVKTVKRHTITVLGVVLSINWLKQCDFFCRVVVIREGMMWNDVRMVWMPKDWE